MIKMLFVDDRLLHGQIALKWAAHYHLTDILVVNDEASFDEFTKMILDLAKPKNVYLHITELNKSLSKINELMEQPGNAIIIVSNLFDAKQIVDKLDFKVDINVVGLRERLNSLKINERVALSREDISLIGKIIKNGINLKLQILPNSEQTIVNEDYLNELDKYI